MLSNYKTYKFLLLICLCISLLSCDSDQQYDQIDLAGEWQVRFVDFLFLGHLKIR